jgi:hypothetical protein
MFLRMRLRVLGCDETIAGLAELDGRVRVLGDGDVHAP